MWGWGRGWWLQKKACLRARVVSQRRESASKSLTLFCHCWDCSEDFVAFTGEITAGHRINSKISSTYLGIKNTFSEVSKHNTRETIYILPSKFEYKTHIVKTPHPTPQKKIIKKIPYVKLPFLWTTTANVSEAFSNSSNSILANTTILHKNVISSEEGILFFIITMMCIS